MTYSPLSTSDADPESAVGKIMKEKDMSFEDAFWEWFASTGFRNETVNGYVFSFTEFPPSRTGHDSGKRNLMIPRLSRVLTIGKITKIGTARGPNTARTVSSQEYDSIDGRVTPCRMKGCFDRYQCLWYDMREEDGGPWNEIPEEWVVGGEMCESFFSKLL